MLHLWVAVNLTYGFIAGYLCVDVALIIRFAHDQVSCSMQPIVYIVNYQTSKLYMHTIHVYFLRRKVTCTLQVAVLDCPSNRFRLLNASSVV